VAAAPLPRHAGADPQRTADRARGTATYHWRQSIRHVSYLGDLVGIDNVAIGSDHSEVTPRQEWDTQFGKGGRYPRITGLMGAWYAYDTRFTESGSTVDDLPLVAEAVARLGLSASELEGVLGGSFLRVCRQVWGG